MTVTAPAPAAIVLLTQGSDRTDPLLAAGGNRTIPAIVLASSALVVSVFALSPENTHGVASGVQHSSIAPDGARSWSWPPASGNSNA